MTKINVRRVYDDPDSDTTVDGLRIYVDRLWPRGESKEKFHYDIWEKDIAPSTELREWFHQNPDDNWSEFERRYTAELKANDAVQKLVDTIRGHKLVTLLYSSKDEAHNNAVVLADYLRGLV